MNNFGEVIYAYTRKQALEDGLQVEVSPEIARQFYKYPVYMTSGVKQLIEQAVNNPKTANDFEGVLWDILTTSIKCSKTLSQSLVSFQTIITGISRKKYYDFLAEVGPIDIDDPKPCVCIMLPEER